MQLQTQKLSEIKCEAVWSLLQGWLNFTQVWHNFGSSLEAVSNLIHLRDVTQSVNITALQNSYYYDIINIIKMLHVITKCYDK